MAKRTLRDRLEGLLEGVLAVALCIAFVVLINVFGLVGPAEPGSWSYWVLAFVGVCFVIGLIGGVGMVVAMLARRGLGVLTRLVRR